MEMSDLFSEDSLKEISSIFCGDVGGFYNYKSGSKLVQFFNQYFACNDVYGQGFPSRWAYVYNKIIELNNSGKVNDYFNLILSKEYVLSDLRCTEVDAVSQCAKILIEFNRILKPNMLTITRKGDRYLLIKEDADLEFVGGGGFANAYLQKSTGRILKKLKEDYLTDAGIRSRFKREYNITKELKDIATIIKVYDFDEGSCQYTMERAEKTLEKFIRESDLDENYKITCIRQILHTMKLVHERDIIHRDISPNNIFILNGMLKIADFGLGKDLHMFTSHNTFLTNAVGQFHYCAPEQFMLLKDGDKRSDVYSLGRLINFIMTKNCNNYHHIFKSVTEKATNNNTAFRQADAGVLLNYVEKCLEYHIKKQNKEEVNKKIQQGILDEDVESYICELTAEDICKFLVNKQSGFQRILLAYMQQNETHANDVMQGIEGCFREICRQFVDNDPIATFSYNVLVSDAFGFVVKELAANMLRYVAYDVNRYYAQGLVEDAKKYGLEPMIEDILV
jgi:tRNA A-37 threonylcarbamoyl transferase component Bud32